MPRTPESPRPERAMGAMRGYTTATLCITVAVMAGASAVAMLSGSRDDPLPLAIATLVVGAGTVVLAGYWERRPRWWLAALVIAATLGVWAAAVLTGTTPAVAVLAAFAIALVASHARAPRWPWLLAGAAAMAAPVAVATLLAPATPWFPLLTVALGAYAAMVVVIALNAFGWRMYLELDRARRAARDLAIAQERYRFAADLHDIQGHTLHVARLKIQLARRLLDQEPAAAATHLAEAESLIAQTLADTKRLAYGERDVALEHELANARALFAAAGIDCTVSGSAAMGPADELFGLLMRESATNILRHAQASSVRIELGERRMRIENDGGPAAMRPPSGLARLAERFEAGEGSLRVALSDGRFVAEAALP